MLTPVPERLKRTSLCQGASRLYLDNSSQVVGGGGGEGKHGTLYVVLLMWLSGVVLEGQFLGASEFQASVSRGFKDIVG